MSIPITRGHQDPGLQPERTVMSWGRTTLSLFVVSAVFLRWMPHFGPSILVLVSVAAVGALSLYVTQRRRYGTRTRGIAEERLEADVAAILWTAGSVMILGVLALVVVITA